MRRALEARAVVAQVAEQKEAGRAAMAASQVCTADMHCPASWKAVPCASLLAQYSSCAVHVAWPTSLPSKLSPD